MRLSTTQSMLVAAPPATVFDVVTDSAALTRAMRRHGPIPGVIRVEWPAGSRLAPGAVRHVTMTDGSILTERIEELDRPSLYRYELFAGIRPPLSLLVRSGTSTWRFERASSGTRIRWEFAFELTSRAAWPAASALLRLFFAPWMRRALVSIRDQALAVRAPGPTAGATT